MASADKKIATYVFLHSNTTCLPDDDHECRITEICMLAINRKAFKEANDQAATPSRPRVTNKLVLCLKPGEDIIQERATSISGLTNEMLLHQRPFTSDTVSVMQSFLKHLKEPICLISHYGNKFDFAVLRKELKCIGQLAAFDHVCCADSLEALRELDPPDTAMSFHLTTSPKRKSDDSTKTSLKRIKTAPASSARQTPEQAPVLQKLFSLPPETPRQKKSYVFRDYYRDKFGLSPRNSHTTEGYCCALIKVAQATPNFFKWVNKNKKKFSEINPA